MLSDMAVCGPVVWDCCWLLTVAGWGQALMPCVFLRRAAQGTGVHSADQLPADDAVPHHHGHLPVICQHWQGLWWVLSAAHVSGEW